MVSDEYRKLEDRTASRQFIHDDIVDGIVQQLGKEKAIIEQAIYRTCITTGVPPTDAAFIVNEFLVFLHEIEHVKENIWSR